MDLKKKLNMNQLMALFYFSIFQTNHRLFTRKLNLNQNCNQKYIQYNIFIKIHFNY